MTLEITLNLNKQASRAMRLIHFDEYDPHHVLGLHEDGQGGKVIRLWRPGAEQVFLEVFGEAIEARRIHEAGLFEYSVPAYTTFNDYKVYHQNGMLGHDPYSFLPSIGEMDLYLFGKGVHYHLYDVMGGRLTQHYGIEGVRLCMGSQCQKRCAGRRF